MVQARWQPVWNVLQRFENEVNDMFNRYGASAPSAPGLSYAYPALSVWSDENNVYVEAELPGMNRDQLQILVSEGNQLTIAGERKPCDVAGATWHRQERGFGKFSRSVTLPVLVDADKVEARLENGVLLLTLPKSESAKPRRIPVKGV
jgi:HSP20 family protein